MTTVVDLRIATLEDAEAIARIHVETWRSTYAGMLPGDLLVGMSLEKQTEMWQRMLRGGETVVVAEDPRYGIIGFGSYGPNRSTRSDFTGEVFTLYLLPDFQGLGIGQGLLRALFGALAREGHENALIWVLAMNPTRFFYEAMGGKPV
ncbi:MAG: GNAT family N-acetyltransferase, partial [Alphaproteobacteria bacterium]|nr:GNAT family N-acetyltransferase [Alphaproteobacteria bacterium]